MYKCRVTWLSAKNKNNKLFNIHTLVILAISPGSFRTDPCLYGLGTIPTSMYCRTKYIFCYHTRNRMFLLLSIILHFFFFVHNAYCKLQVFLCLFCGSVKHKFSEACDSKQKNFWQAGIFWIVSKPKVYV